MKIVAAPDPGVRGVTGVVEDETRNMLTIRTDHKSIRVPKQKSSFLLELPSRDTVTIPGDSVRYRPEDRVKKGLGKW